MNLHVCAHCWNYSRLLVVQLSSYILNPPVNCHVTVTIFFSREDSKTCEVLEFFQPLQPRNVTWDFRPLETPQLLRRAIGRNLVTEYTKADWVLFIDVDYIFGDGCLDAFACVAAKSASSLLFPDTVLSSPSHASGDSLIESIAGPSIVQIDPSQFTPLPLRRAIGGTQYVRGDVAREIGYCRGHRKFQQPASRWKRTFCDRTFRGILGTAGEPIQLPNLFRIRHSKRGRFDVGCEL